jgi:hypothetical protein
MESFDYKTAYKHLYLPSAKEASIVDVPPMKFAMVDGKGDPNTFEQFQDAVGALYGVTYTIKMLPKKGIVPDGYVIYNIPPLEGLWWVEGEKPFTFDVPKEDYRWTVMIMQPAFVTQELVNKAVEDQFKKKGNPAFKILRFEEMAEGKAVQIMHVGPYSEEPASLAKMEDLADRQGYRFHGKHHEIYLGDPRRTKPEKLRTVLRHPVMPK